jgi:ankyrin repeat protein
MNRSVSTEDNRGLTSDIIIAAREGDQNLEVVRLLLASGADVDLHWGGDPGNALQVAARRDYKDDCAILIAYGADVHLASGSPECSPLETAYQAGSTGVLEMLLKHSVKTPYTAYRSRPLSWSIGYRSIPPKPQGCSLC